MSIDLLTQHKFQVWKIAQWSAEKHLTALIAMFTVFEFGLASLDGVSVITHFVSFPAELEVIKAKKNELSVAIFATGFTWLGENFPTIFEKKFKKTESYAFGLGMCFGTVSFILSFVDLAIANIVFSFFSGFSSGLFYYVFGKKNNTMKVLMQSLTLLSVLLVVSCNIFDVYDVSFSGWSRYVARGTPLKLVLIKLAKDILDLSIASAINAAVLAFASASNARKMLHSNQCLNQERQRNTHVAPFSKTYKFVSSLPAKAGEQPKEHEVEVTFLNGDANQAQVSIGGKVINIKGNANLALPVNSLEVNGEHITTQIVGKRAGEITVRIFHGTALTVKVLPHGAADIIDLKAITLSSMAGAIKNINVKPGDMVSEGQELVGMEAMKMQNSLHAAKAGRVKAVNVKVGATVDEGEVLVELE